MAAPRQVRRSGTRYSKNTVGRTYSTKDEAGQKHKPTDVFDFPDNSGISSIGRLGENEKDEEPYETFDPPLHSTAIYADEEEFSKHCGSSLPSTPQGKEAKRSSDTSDVEASENESVKISAKKPRRKLKPISDESESTEESDVRRRVKPAENLSTQREAVSATASSEPSEKPAESVTLKKKTQKKKMFRGKRKKPRSEATDLDTSDCVPIWCLKEKKTSDIMELDVVLSAFENILLEYKQKTDSRICKEAINKFHSNLKEELIKMLKEVQMLKTLKRKNTKMISDIEKKRQRLIEVQDELLRLEPELNQLQIKYDELKERKASLRSAAYFLSNLKQLHQDYSDIQEEEPNVKETYDSSSLPALLFKARPLLGAENHLQNINYQLEKLLDQK
ncbi:centromere protein U isoform X1 [Neophocaena asiaeorientalis asiaeorientalis]|uniref:Centromere protein U n=1 Tax=Neophocaena asiaeorientalis asiaeorientalis TaxID=1706337 RepID=A0A341CMR1_NEOAA|nr:centromere protein U isoform X1 [Neophocaena asiaeorientalis asiaeorientalis]